MAITIGTTFATLGEGGAATSQGQPIRGSNWRTLIANEHFVRARQRELGGIAYEYTTTTSSPSWDTVLTWEARLSENSSEDVRMEIYGQNVDVRLSITDGVDTVQATASVGGTEGAATTSAMTAAPVDGGVDALLTFTMEVRSSSGTATLKSARVYEQPHSTSTIT